MRRWWRCAGAGLVCPGSRCPPSSCGAPVTVRFGKHHVKLPLADPQKTWEGSAGMALVSTAVGTASMLALTAMPLHQCLLYALATSVPGAYTELISRGGNDTVTVPLVNTAVLLALYVIFH